MNHCFEVQARKWVGLFFQQWTQCDRKKLLSSCFSNETGPWLYRRDSCRIFMTEWGHEQTTHRKLTVINRGSSSDRPYIINVRSYDNKRASHLISATEDMTKHHTSSNYLPTHQTANSNQKLCENVPLGDGHLKLHRLSYRSHSSGSLMGERNVYRWVRLWIQI